MRKAALLFSGIIACTVLFTCLEAGVSPALAEEVFPIDVTADRIEYLTEEKAVVAEGNVKITYKEVVLYCDKARANNLTRDVIAEGNIKIVEEGKEREITSTRIVYNMETRKATAYASEIYSPPFYGWAEEGTMGEGRYDLYKAWATTCDINNPHWADWRMTSNHITIYPEDRIVGRNVILWINKVPIFYLPYYSQPFKSTEFNFGLLPGSDNDWGIYVLSWYKFRMGENVKGKIHFDWREKKGLAEGMDFNVQSTPLGHFDFRYYRTEEGQVRDSEPRYRADVRHQYNLWGNDNHYITSEFHKFTDEKFLKDYFYREYIKDRTPDSYIYFNNLFEDSSLTFYANKQANSFFNNTDVLPELSWEVYDLKLPFNLYYSMDSNVGYFDNRFSDSDYHQNSFRLSNKNELRYTEKFGFLYVSPFAGVQNTYYSETEVDTSVNRLFFESGVDTSFSVFRLYNLSDENELRHIIQPKLSYLYRHRPTFEGRRTYIFDDTDTDDYYDGFLFSIKNLFQVDYFGEKWDFLDLDVGVDYLIDSQDEGKGFNDLMFEARFRTLSLITLHTDSVYSLKDDRFDESANDLTLQLNKNLAYSVGYHYKYGDTDTLVSEITTDIVEYWKFTYYNRYDFVEGKFQEHQFKVTKELPCWFADFIISFNHKGDIGFYVAFRLKAFPDEGVKFDATYGPED